MERLIVSWFAVHNLHDFGDNRYPLKGSQHQLIATGAGLLLKYSALGSNPTPSAERKLLEHLRRQQRLVNICQSAEGIRWRSLSSRWAIAHGYKPGEVIRYLSHRGILESPNPAEYVIEAQLPVDAGD
jgi:hypothetical protein